MRKKVDERRFFSIEEKQEILKKSNSKCCVCGKHLKIEDDFTVDHIIPLSKGGTNDIANLCALCFNCNQLKDNKVVSAIGYLPYLNPEFVKIASKDLIAYLDKGGWLTMNQLTPLEVFPMAFTVPSKSNAVSRDLVRRFNMKLARYSDLDAVYRFILKYNRQYHSDVSKEDTKKYIDYFFKFGCIYFLENSFHEIEAVFPMGVSLFNDGTADFTVYDCLGFSKNEQLITILAYYFVSVLAGDLMLEFPDSKCASFLFVFDTASEFAMKLHTILDTVDIGYTPDGKLVGNLIKVQGEWKGSDELLNKEIMKHSKRLYDHMSKRAVHGGTDQVEIAHFNNLKDITFF